MNCDFYISLINGRLDGINTAAEEEQLQEHLKNCENCRTLLSVMQENDALIRANKAEAPADLTAKIMQKVRNNPKRSSRKVFYTSLAATGIATAAMLGIFVSGNVQPSEPEGISVVRETSFADVAKRSVRNVGVLVLHGSSEDLDFEGEKLDIENLPDSIERAGYPITGNETEAYSVSWSEIKRISKEYGEAFDAAFYNPNANSNGILIFVDE